MYDQQATIGELLEAAAARQPTPGGGSATALVGALSAAMGEMVLNYTVGKKNLAGHEPELKQALSSFTRARQLLTELMVEDQAAFEAIAAIKKLPAESPERKDRLPPALLACIRAPQAMAATGVAILDLCGGMAQLANRYLLSDLAVCADLAMATVRCAVYNVRVNLGEIEDEADRRSIQSTCDQMLSHALRVIQKVIPSIWERIDKES